MKAPAVLAWVGMLYCCVGSDSTIRGCSDQSVRFGEGCLRGGSFEEIRRGDVWGVMLEVVVAGDAG